jgi:hypothetical protein
MTSNLLKAAQRAMFASLLVAAVAACSTAPVQTAALPQEQGWVDSAQLPAGADAPDGLVSNADGGN